MLLVLYCELGLLFASNFSCYLVLHPLEEIFILMLLVVLSEA